MRRRAVRMHKLLEANQLWPARGTCTAELEGLPMSWAEEIVGIVGRGRVRLASSKLCC
jgi:hypothetical protein